MLHFGRTAAPPETCEPHRHHDSYLCVAEHVNLGLVLWKTDGWLPVSEVRRLMAPSAEEVQGNATLHAVSLLFFQDSETY
jgi:hypothetical protein